VFVTSRNTSAVALDLRGHLMQDERRAPTRDAIRRKISDLLLNVMPTDQDRREIRTERQRKSAGNGVAIRDDQRAPAVVEQKPASRMKPAQNALP